MKTTPLPSVEEIQDKMSSLRAKFVSKKIGYAKWANGVDKLLTQRDHQAYTSLVKGIEGMKSDPTLPVDDALYSRSDIDREVDKTLADILENVVKPLYGKK